MLDKLKPHFLKLVPRRFVIGTVIILTILDIANSYYLRLYWVHKDLSLQMVKAISIGQSLTYSDLSTSSVNEIKGLIDNAFFFFLFIILLNNLFFYFFYLRKKLWAQGYVLFYTLTTGILSITFIAEGAILGWNWFIYNASTFLIYSYLYLGIKLLKNETTNLPNPARGTKAQ